MLLLSLSLGGVRFGGLELDLDSISCAGLLFAFGFLLEDDLADAGRDVRFGGLGLSLSFSFDRVRLGGLGLGPVCCMDVEPGSIFVLLIGGERADIDDLEFEREGGGVGATGGLAHFADDDRADVDFDSTRSTGALSVLLEGNDRFPSAVFGLSFCSSFALRGVRCDDTARRT